MLLVFGIFLVITGIRIVQHDDNEGETSSTLGLSLLKRVMPVSDELDGHNFFTVKNGVRAATPLFAALVVIEATDVVFALDSVPAVLAVSNEPFLVFSANAFAILGLRAMYFLLANARERFHYLSHGLGGILIFVGLKMTVSHWYHLNTYISLGIIVSMLIAAIVVLKRDTSAACTLAVMPCNAFSSVSNFCMMIKITIPERTTTANPRKMMAGVLAMANAGWEK